MRRRSAVIRTAGRHQSRISGSYPSHSDVAAFDSFAPALSLLRLPVYVTRVPAARFCETPLLLARIFYRVLIKIASQLRVQFGVTSAKSVRLLKESFDRYGEKLGRISGSVRVEQEIGRASCR